MVRRIDASNLLYFASLPFFCKFLKNALCFAFNVSLASKILIALPVLFNAILKFALTVNTSFL